MLFFFGHTCIEYEKVLQLSSQSGKAVHPETVANLGALHLELGHYEDAYRFLDMAENMLYSIRDELDRVLANSSVGRAGFEEEGLQEARTRVEVNIYTIRFNLARLAEARGHTEDAIHSYISLIVDHPHSEDGL